MQPVLSTTPARLLFFLLVLRFCSPALAHGRLGPTLSSDPPAVAALWPYGGPPPWEELTDNDILRASFLLESISHTPTNSSLAHYLRSQFEPGHHSLGICTAQRGRWPATDQDIRVGMALVSTEPMVDNSVFDRDTHNDASWTDGGDALKTILQKCEESHGPLTLIIAIDGALQPDANFSEWVEAARGKSPHLSVVKGKVHPRMLNQAEQLSQVWASDAWTALRNTAGLRVLVTGHGWSGGVAHVAHLLMRATYAVDAGRGLPWMSLSHGSPLFGDEGLKNHLHTHQLRSRFVSVIRDNDPAPALVNLGIRAAAAGKDAVGLWEKTMELLTVVCTLPICSISPNCTAVVLAWGSKALDAFNAGTKLVLDKLTVHYTPIGSFRMLIHHSATNSLSWSSGPEEHKVAAELEKYAQEYKSDAAFHEPKNYRQHLQLAMTSSRSLLPEVGPIPPARRPQPVRCEKLHSENVGGDPLAQWREKQTLMSLDLIHNQPQQVRDEIESWIDSDSPQLLDLLKMKLGSDLQRRIDAELKAKKIRMPGTADGKGRYPYTAFTLLQALRENAPSKAGFISKINVYQHPTGAIGQELVVLNQFQSQEVVGTIVDAFADYDTTWRHWSFLLSGATNATVTIELNGDCVPVRAEVQRMDTVSLHEYLKGLDVRKRPASGWIATTKQWMSASFGVREEDEFTSRLIHVSIVQDKVVSSWIKPGAYWLWRTTDKDVWQLHAAGQNDTVNLPLAECTDWPCAYQLHVKDLLIVPLGSASQPHSPTLLCSTADDCTFEAVPLNSIPVGYHSPRLNHLVCQSPMTVEIPLSEPVERQLLLRFPVATADESSERQAKLVKQLIADIRTEHSAHAKLLDWALDNYQHPRKHVPTDLRAVLPNVLADQAAAVAALGSQHGLNLNTLEAVLLHCANVATYQLVVAGHEGSILQGEALELFRQAAGSFEQIREGDNIVLVVGGTGSGKTTFLDFVLGYAMIQRELPSGQTVWEIDPDEPLPRFWDDDEEEWVPYTSGCGAPGTIGHSAIVSQTWMTDCCQYYNDATWWADTMGVSESRPVHYSLAAALSFDQTVQRGRVVSLVVAIPYDDFFSNRGDKVIDMFRRVGWLNPTAEVQKWANGVFILVTKHGDRAEKNFYREFSENFCNLVEHESLDAERKYIWSAVCELNRLGRIHFANVGSVNKLNEIRHRYANPNQPLPSPFTPMLDTDEMRIPFAYFVESGQTIWMEKFSDFLKEQPSRKAKALQEIDMLKEEERTQRVELTEVEARLKSNREQLAALERGESVDSESIRAQVEKATAMAQRDVNEKRKWLDKTQSDIKVKEALIEQEEKSIPEQLSEIARLEVGEVERQLYRLRISSHDQLLRCTLKDNAMEVAMLRGRKINSEDCAQHKEPVRAGDYTGVLTFSDELSAKYRLVPDKSELRDEFLRAGIAVEGQFRYEAIVKGHAYHINGRRLKYQNGTTITYYWNLHFIQNQELPWIEIWHKLPQKVVEANRLNGLYRANGASAERLERARLQLADMQKRAEEDKKTWREAVATLVTMQQTTEKAAKEASIAAEKEAVRNNIAVNEKHQDELKASLAAIPSKIAAEEAKLHAVHTERRRLAFVVHTRWSTVEALVGLAQVVQNIPQVQTVLGSKSTFHQTAVQFEQQFMSQGAEMLQQCSIELQIKCGPQ